MLFSASVFGDFSDTFLLSITINVRLKFHRGRKKEKKITGGFSGYKEVFNQESTFLSV